MCVKRRQSMGFGTSLGPFHDLVDARTTRCALRNPICRCPHPKGYEVSKIRRKIDIDLRDRIGTMVSGTSSPRSMISRMPGSSSTDDIGTALVMLRCHITERFFHLNTSIVKPTDVSSIIILRRFSNLHRGDWSSTDYSHRPSTAYSHRQVALAY